MSPIMGERKEIKIIFSSKIISHNILMKSYELIYLFFLNKSDYFLVKITTFLIYKDKVHKRSLSMELVSNTK